MPAVCAYCEESCFSAVGTRTNIAAANARDPVVIPQTVLYQEIRTELSTSFDRRFHQHLIELAAPRCVSPSPVSHPNVSSKQREISEGSKVGGKRRTIRANYLLQKTPVRESLRAMSVYKVPPVYITGNNSSLKQQNSMPLAGEQHRCYRTRAAGTNYNCVVHVTSDILRILHAKEMLAGDWKLGL